MTYVRRFIFTKQSTKQSKESTALNVLSVIQNLKDMEILERKTGTSQCFLFVCFGLFLLAEVTLSRDMSN